MGHGLHAKMIKKLHIPIKMTNSIESGAAGSLSSDLNGVAIEEIKLKLRMNFQMKIGSSGEKNLTWIENLSKELVFMQLMFLIKNKIILLMEVLFI